MKGDLLVSQDLRWSQVGDASLLRILQIGDTQGHCGILSAWLGIPASGKQTNQTKSEIKPKFTFSSIHYLSTSDNLLSGL